MPPIGPTDVGVARVSVLLNLPPGCDKRRTLSTRPRKKSKSRTGAFEFSAPDADATFSCKIDKKPFKPCSPLQRVRKLKPGKHTFRLVATDAGGNVGDPTFFRWRVVD